MTNLAPSDALSDLTTCPGEVGGGGGGRKGDVEGVGWGQTGYLRALLVVAMQEVEGGEGNLLYTVRFPSERPSDGFFWGGGESSGQPGPGPGPVLKLYAAGSGTISLVSRRH